MEKKIISYKEAMQEVEDILKKLNNEELDVDQLGAQVKRAGELIALCKEKLRKAESDVAKVISEK